MGDIGKVIKISTKDYESLHELKFDLRVDTYGEIIHYLIKEHEKKHCLEAPA